MQRVREGLPTLVYFQNKLGGVISIGATARSPEFSFDATVIELLPAGMGAVRRGRYGIIEIQTMDFQGTFAAATTARRGWRRGICKMRLARRSRQGTQTDLARAAGMTQSRFGADRRRFTR